MMRAAMILFAFVLSATAAQAQSSRILLTAPTTFYTSPGGTDAAGCGTSASPCATVQYLYNVIIQPGYDLGCQRVTIQRRTSANPPDVYNDAFTAVKPVVGQCGSTLVANGTNVVFPPQIVIQGDPVTPANVIWRPTSGEAAISSQWEAALYVEGFTFEGDAFSGEMLLNTTSRGYLGIGNNVFGCNPGKIDIQPSVRSDVVVFAGYTIDQTQCGGSLPPPVNTNASVSSGSNQMGLASPGGVQACINAGNCIISAANVPAGTKALSLNVATVTMSNNATGSNGFEPVTLQASGSGAGCAKAHDQQDAWSQFQVIPGIQVTLKNTPCYNDAGFMMLDDAQAYIQGVTWKGGITGGAANLWRNSVAGRVPYVFNNGGSAPQDNTLVFTP